MIRVGMSFYTKGREQNAWTFMPQVPCRGDRLFYSMTGDPDEGHWWEVKYVSWVHDDTLHGENKWHAEIGLD